MRKKKRKIIEVVDKKQILGGIVLHIRVNLNSYAKYYA